MWYYEWWIFKDFEGGDHSLFEMAPFQRLPANRSEPDNTSARISRFETAPPELKPNRYHYNNMLCGDLSSDLRFSVR
jgi:hypothetical protein